MRLWLNAFGISSAELLTEHKKLINWQNSVPNYYYTLYRYM